ncbi:MAG: IgGFc-binding protein, partial [Myxococcales bacterium]|nr:IgGFc-binding protein [Myxococcales bacterium]
ALALALASPGCSDDGGPPGSTGGPEGTSATTEGPASSGTTLADTTGDTTVGTTLSSTTAGVETTMGLESATSTGGETTTGEPTTTTTGPSCVDGEITCDGMDAVPCEGGEPGEPEPCTAMCLEGYGCVACVPGESACNGQNVYHCDDVGEIVGTEHCDPVQGLECDQGQCVGACAPGWLGADHRGCEFYPTVTATIVNELFNFAVTVVNTSDLDEAHIQIERGGQLVVMDSVPAGGVERFTLPWVPALKAELGVDASTVVEDGAYRLRADVPVLVYQHNPYEYAQGEELAMTGDGALLLPRHMWSGEYRVVARNSWWHEISLSELPGFYTVTASEDLTLVMLSPSSTGQLVLAGDGVMPAGNGVVTLDRGDVLQVYSAGTQSNPSPSDLTGTGILADAPVQVIGGHMCSYVPYYVGACDHLEEVMPPVYALDTTHVATAPASPDRNSKARARVVRIIATEPNTSIVYTPAIDGAPAKIEGVGDYVELPPTTADFVIDTSAPVVVAQYMLGKNYDLMGGDPSMIVLPGVQQYRDSYLFAAPDGFPMRYATIVAPTSADVQLDDVVVTNYTLIPGADLKVARVPLSDPPGGRHLVVSTMPVHVDVHGYAPETSFWYPAGHGLKTLAEP